ncbi:MAG: hypothetical protein RBS07_08910 [Lentimicrobium sp.]|jgi:hypothetical protein|nr:hypothetical protein [Lentimicrobium sp.]
MKKIVALLIPVLLAATSIDDGLYSIVTTKDDALINHKYTKFVVVDDETQYVLAKTTVKYDLSKEMPINYFTVDLTNLIPGKQRAFIIHNLLNDTNGDDYDWVLEENADDNATFFSRSNFISMKTSMQWLITVRGERVLLKNCRTGAFLKVDTNGSYLSVNSETEASRWKFIHIF